MGASLYKKAPHIYFRDCVDCKEYIYDSSGPIKNPEGKKIKRPKEMPVNCSRCKKWDEKSNCAFTGFTQKNQYIFNSFLLAKAFSVLPRKGGIDDQDPKIMNAFILLNTLFDCEDEVQKQKLFSSIKIGI